MRILNFVLSRLMKDLPTIFKRLMKLSLALFFIGNELCGKGVGASVGAEQYGKDSIRLNAMIDELYTNFQPRPRILAPGGFYDKSWFDKLLQTSGPDVVNVMSHHMYSLGPGGFSSNLIAI